MLHTDFEQNLFVNQAGERFLGVDERDEALIATTAFIGPLATMFAMQERPFAPMEVARPVATAQEVAQTVEFLPTIEAVTADWRAGARGHVAGAAIMFASERTDFAEYRSDDYALAA